MALANSRACILSIGGDRPRRRREAAAFQLVRYAKPQNHDDNPAAAFRPGAFRSPQDADAARLPQDADAARLPQDADATRRCFISSSMLLAATCLQGFKPASAAAPPPGFELYENLDGFAFAVPERWVQFRGTGPSAFFRNPADIDENVLVEVSSPSSSRYKSIEELGSPDEAAQRVLKQYLLEFMSTRIGVQRESRLVSASSRTAPDGHLFYEVVVGLKSFANNNQMAVMPGERVVRLEWSRIYYSVLGVENNRLYQLRLQTPERALERDGAEFRQIMDSFALRKLTA